MSSRNHAYYVLDNPRIADAEYDALMRELRALEAAQTELELAALCGRHQLELFAEHLRLAQNACNTITGEFNADDLLGVIFSRFCIGK